MKRLSITQLFPGMITAADVYDLDVKTLLQNTLAIVANHSGSISLLDMLQNMREYNDSTYTHRLNVALICNILARWLKLNFYT